MSNKALVEGVFCQSTPNFKFRPSNNTLQFPWIALADPFSSGEHGCPPPIEQLVLPTPSPSPSARHLLTAEALLRHRHLVSRLPLLLSIFPWTCQVAETTITVAGTATITIKGGGGGGGGMMAVTLPIPFPYCSY